MSFPRFALPLFPLFWGMARLTERSRALRELALVASAAFLEGVISWRAIAEIIREVLEDHDGTTPKTLDVVIEADRRARERARRAVERRATQAP